MDKSDALIKAKQFAEVITDKYHPEKIFLFGSYAKGSYHEESDIDIAVIFKDYDNSIDMQLELMRLRRGIDSRIEPHPFRLNDFTPSNPVVFEILKFGQEIVLV